MIIWYGFRLNLFHGYFILKFENIEMQKCRRPYTYNTGRDLTHWFFKSSLHMYCIRKLLVAEVAKHYCWYWESKYYSIPEVQRLNKLEIFCVLFILLNSKFLYVYYKTLNGNCCKKFTSHRIWSLLMCTLLFASGFETGVLTQLASFDLTPFRITTC